MHGEHEHSYALEAASFYVAMVFPVALFAMMAFGRSIEAFKRARKLAKA